MVHGVDPFARLGIASLRLPEYSGRPWIVYILFYVPLIFLALWLSRWNPLKRPDGTKTKPATLRIALVAQACMLALVIAHPFSAGAPDGKLRIDFLDVGQGDAALVTMPDGTTLLVDGGGRPTFSKRETDKETFERDAPVSESRGSE